MVRHWVQDFHTITEEKCVEGQDYQSCTDKREGLFVFFPEATKRVKQHTEKYNKKRNRQIGKQPLMHDDGQRQHPTFERNGEKPTPTTVQHGPILKVDWHTSRLLDGSVSRLSRPWSLSK